MARPILTLTLLFLASGCRDQSPPAGGADAAADAGPKLALPNEIQTGTAVCALKTEHYLPLEDQALTATGTTPPFASIAAGTAPGAPKKYPRAELGITAEEDLPFVLRVVGGAEIRALVPRTTAIHASGPFALGKFAAAMPQTKLAVKSATSLDVEVEAQLGDTVESLDGPLHARGPCALFAIERTRFNPTTVIPGVKWKQDPDGALKRGKKIPLTVLPIGEPSAKLFIGPKDDPAVAVLEKQNGRAHIAWFGNVLVHGWIAESDLAPVPTAPAASAAASASASASASAPASASAVPVPPPAAALSRLTCPEPVPLVAQTGESRTTVGTVRASAAFDVLAKDKGWASVRVEVSLFTLAPGARLVVRESDLAACTTVKENPR